MILPLLNLLGFYHVLPVSVKYLLDYFTAILKIDFTPQWQHEEDDKAKGKLVLANMSW